MVKRLLKDYEWFVAYFIANSFMCGKVDAIQLAVKTNKWIRKGQHQMLADYLMLELLEQGRL